MRLEQWNDMSKRHKEERRLLIEFCRAHGMNQTEAAQALGVNASTFSKYLKSNGLQWSKKRQRLKVFNAAEERALSNPYKK